MSEEKKAPPLKYLLTCSDGEVGSFELLKLSEVANLRNEMLELFDRLVDTSAQAVLAAWLRTIDREELKRQLLESSTVTIEGIMAEAKAQIRNQGRSKEEAENYGEMPSHWKYATPEEAKQARKAYLRDYREAISPPASAKNAPSRLTSTPSANARSASQSIASETLSTDERRGFRQDTAHSPARWLRLYGLPQRGRPRRSSLSGPKTCDTVKAFSEAPKKKTALDSAFIPRHCWPTDFHVLYAPSWSSSKLLGRRTLESPHCINSTFHAQFAPQMHGQLLSITVHTAE